MFDGRVWDVRAFRVENDKANVTGQHHWSRRSATCTNQPGGGRRFDWDRDGAPAQHSLTPENRLHLRYLPLVCEKSRKLGTDCHHRTERHQF